MSERSGQYVPPPDNHLGLSLIALLLFFPLGIPALINSVKVSRLWNEGQHPEALKAASSAKRFAIWAIVVLVALVGAYVALRVRAA